MLELAAMFALGANIAATYVITFVWSPTASYTFTFGLEQMHLFIHLIVIFVTSFLFGAIMGDIGKTFVYTIGSTAIGALLAIALITAPTIMLTEYAAFMDTTMTVAVVAVARLFIVGATFLILGAIIGSLTGDTLAGRIESRNP